MDGTILSQGTFIATGTSSGATRTDQGNAQIIQIPSNADWLQVFNYTKAGANGSNVAYFNGNNNAFIGVEFYWQRGMAPGTGMVKYKGNAAATLAEDTFVSGGFTLYDPSGQSGSAAAPLVGPAIATTDTSNATQPVVSTGNTSGLTVGSVVRLSNNGGANTSVYGIDMVVSAITVNTNFTLLFASNALATAPGQDGGNGFWRSINVDSPFYPRKRFVTNITQAVNPTVATSVAHGLTPGQAIRFNIPAVSGMVQLNPTSANNYQYATVQTVVDDYSFTIDINTTNFTAFTFPVFTQTPCSYPELHPVGENTASALVLPGSQVPSVGGIQIPNTNTGILADSTVNTLFLGMILGAGGNGKALTTPILGPSGTVTTAGGVTTGDTMYWVAGKSSYGGL
jgi:hypothetical protein